MKNKQVKQMMCDVFDGYWVDGSEFVYAQTNGMVLMVFGGWLGDERTDVGLNKTVSIKANEVK